MGDDVANGTEADRSAFGRVIPFGICVTLLAEDPEIQVSPSRLFHSTVIDCGEAARRLYLLCWD
jgi:hypothetical protein